ncbi:MAG: FAD:protein FMN transferase [Pseudomonadota bacterium]
MMRRAQPWLGTLVDISVDISADGASSQARAHQAIDLAFAQIALVQRLMSFHAPDSDVTRLNAAAPGASVAVDAHTYAVLRLAEDIAAACGGVFNIACAPRLVAWNMLPAPAAAPAHLPAHLPAYLAGQPVLACQGDGTVRKCAAGWVDLGGIAKGYAVDLAVTALADAGVARACVNAGGDLRVIGSHPVAIRDPRHPQRAAHRLTLENEAMATSASYFSAGEWEGAAVCALVDGRSGAPIKHAASASVRAARCAVADALTKLVLATRDLAHPALGAFGATAFII